MTGFDLKAALAGAFFFRSYTPRGMSVISLVSHGVTTLKDMKTESQLQNYLKREAKKAGIGCDKLESRSRRGWPDCILYKDGAVMLVELKSPAGTGRLTALQDHCIKNLRKQGLDVRVVSNKEEVDAALIAMGS